MKTLIRWIFCYLPFNRHIYCPNRQCTGRVVEAQASLC